MTRNTFEKSMAFVLAAIAAAFLSACGDGSLSRSAAIAALNEDGPREFKLNLYVCDLSSPNLRSLPDGRIFSVSDAARIRCGNEDVEGGAHNFRSDVVAVFFRPENLRQVREHLNPIDTTTWFDGYDHHYLYTTTDSAQLGRSAPDFVTVTPGPGPYVRLTLKILTYRAVVSGIREVNDGRCDAIVEYTYETSDLAPWANLFMQTNEIWTTLQTACFVRYDDGWRIVRDEN